MSIAYVNCPFCGHFLSYDTSIEGPDGSVVLTCTSCHNMFSFIEAPPNVPSIVSKLEDMPHTAPVDAPNVVEEFLKTHSLEEDIKDLLGSQATETSTVHETEEVEEQTLEEATTKKSSRKRKTSTD